MTPSIPLRKALPNLPTDIVDALANEFAELESRFARGDWSPAELNGGRFAEAVLRFLEWRASGQYTPIGKRLDREAILKRVENDASLPDGLRFHVARCSELLLDVRNKRDVAHLGKTIDVDQMDARLVIRLAAWSLSEIVREEAGLSPEDAQALIDGLNVRHLPAVETVGGDLLIVATHLPAGDRALVALYHAFPECINITDLRKAVHYQNTTRFRRLLLEKAKEGIVHLKGDDVYLTGKGVAWLEKNVDMHVKV